MKNLNKHHQVLASCLIVIFAVSGLLFIALDGNHYWHDIRFSYAAAQFSLPEVLAGTFNPHQAWSVSNEVSASGFYTSKMLHLALLSSLFTVVDPSAGGFNLAVSLSVLVMLCTVLLAYVLYVQLFCSRKIALFAAVCVLLAPVVPYLSGKLPVRTVTGTLRRSYRVEKLTPYLFRHRMDSSVANYAKHVHEGTRYLKRRPYFRKAFDGNRQAIMNYWQYQFILEMRKTGRA